MPAPQTYRGRFHKKNRKNRPGNLRPRDGLADPLLEALATRGRREARGGRLDDLLHERVVLDRQTILKEGRDLLGQEPRALGEAVFVAAATIGEVVALRIADEEAIAGPRQRHVKQPSLFFDF